MNDKQKLAVMVAMANLLCEHDVLTKEQAEEIVRFNQYMEQIETAVIGEPVSGDEMTIHAVQGTLAMMEYFKDQYVDEK